MYRYGNHRSQLSQSSISGLIMVSIQIRKKPTSIPVLSFSLSIFSISLSKGETNINAIYADANHSVPLINGIKFLMIFVFDIGIPKISSTIVMAAV